MKTNNYDLSLSNYNLSTYTEDQIMKLMMSHITDIDLLYGIFAHSLRRNYSRTINYLLTNNLINPCCDGNSAIKIAAQYGSTDVIKILLDDGRVDPTIGGNSPVEIAANGGYVAIVYMLMDDERVKKNDSNMKINKKTAPIKTNIDLLHDMFADSIYDDNFYKNILIHANNNNIHDSETVDAIEYMLLNYKLKYDNWYILYIAFIWSIEGNHIKIIDFLLRKISTNVYYSNMLCNLLQSAIVMNKEEIIKMIFHSNAITNLHAKYILLAYEKCSPEIVKLISAKTNMQDVHDIRIHFAINKS